MLETARVALPAPTNPGPHRLAYEYGLVTFGVNCHTLVVKNPLNRTIPNPFAFAMPVRAWIFWFCFTLFMGVTVPAGFFWLAEPSLLGKTDWRWWCDSPVYLYAAGIDTDPALLQDYEGLLSRPPGAEIDWANSFAFASNFTGPLLIGVLAGTNFKIMLVNYAIFLSALWFLLRLKNVHGKLLILLILANPFTIISIWTLNKEIIALLAAALFAYYLEHRRWFLLPVVLLVSFLARWEQAAFVVIFLIVTSRVNPLRNHRLATLVLLVLGMSAVYPSIHSMAEAWGNNSHIMATLNSMQKNYLFFVVLIPKLLMNLAFVVLLFLVQQPDWHDVPNGAGMLIYQALMIGVTVAIVLQRKFHLNSNYIYCAALFSVLCCAGPLIQPRYLYAAYIFMCIELATRRKPKSYAFESTLKQYRHPLASAS